MTERTLGAVLLSAVLLENIVFARALVSGELLSAQSYRRLLERGLRITCITLIGGLVSWLLVGRIEAALADSLWRHPARELVCLAAVCLAYWLVVRFLVPAQTAESLRWEEAGIELGVQVGVAYAIILFGLQQSYSLLFALAWFLASGVGFTLALLLLAAGNERLSFSTVPRAFSGLPVRLLYAGILSMAIYAMVGHQLPT